MCADGHVPLYPCIVRKRSTLSNPYSSTPRPPRSTQSERHRSHDEFRNFTKKVGGSISDTGICCATKTNVCNWNHSTGGNPLVATSNSDSLDTVKPDSSPWTSGLPLDVPSWCLDTTLMWTEMVTAVFPSSHEYPGPLDLDVRVAPRLAHQVVQPHDWWFHHCLISR